MNCEYIFIKRERVLYVFWDRSGEYFCMYMSQERQLMMVSKSVVVWRLSLGVDK
jgi:hypothetical protein